MMAQIRAEVYKLRHTRAFAFTILAYVLLLILFQQSGPTLLMVAGNLSDPNQSIGFFKGAAPGVDGSIQLCVLRSAHSFLIFSWLIGLSLCISFFGREIENRTASLYVCHGGKLKRLYLCKTVVVNAAILVLQSLFTFSCLVFSAWELGYSLTIKDFCQTAVASTLNILVLLAFFSLAVLILTILHSLFVTQFLLCFFPLAGIFMYQTNFVDFESLPTILQFLAKLLPTYYWSNISSLRFVGNIVIEAMLYSVILFCVTLCATIAIVNRREMK